MAEESNIIYKGKGFWIPEGFIEVLSQYICETFENIGVNTFSANLKKIYGSCDGNRSGGYSGMVSIPLDQCIIDQTDKSDFIHVLDKVKSLLQSKGTKLSITILNQFENNKIDPYFIDRMEIFIRWIILPCC
ncbi:hypothetical protein ABID99_003591 [Mucilaginibacter sp. OAE612]|uniref:hypothetical protein n=1 Tax=Mucilaginibacter sp. OAE612 TaxID=3156444 RepID=UPI00359D817D